MTLHFAGYIHLPNKLQVTLEALGQSFDSVIENVHFTVSFPTLLEGGHSGSPLEPPFPSNQWSYADTLSDPGESPWGRASIILPASEGRPERVRSYQVAGLGFHARCDDWHENEEVAELGQRFNRLYSAWYGLARQWFELWTPQDLLGRYRHDFPEGQAWLDDESGSVRMLTGWRGPLGPVMLLSEDQVLTPRIIASSFAHATAGTLPPLEWSLYVNAGHNEDRRQAVIEAATAAEVAAQRAFMDKLGGDDVPDSVIQLLIKQSNGLVGLTNVVRGLGVSVPTQSQIDKKLATVRNNAAHSGVVPSEEDLKAAFEVAHAILAAASPMPQP
jgi:hypothetical protein